MPIETNYMPPIAQEAIEHFAHHINAWLLRDMPDIKPVTVEDFIIGRYANSRMLTDPPGTEMEGHFVVYADYGDDGGGSHLLCSTYDGELTSVTAIVDTMPMFIWERETGYVCLPDNDYRSL